MQITLKFEGSSKQELYTTVAELANRLQAELYRAGGQPGQLHRSTALPVVEAPKMAEVDPTVVTAVGKADRIEQLEDVLRSLFREDGKGRPEYKGIGISPVLWSMAFKLIRRNNRYEHLTENMLTWVQSHGPELKKLAPVFAALTQESAAA